MRYRKFQISEIVHKFNKEYYGIDYCIEGLGFCNKESIHSSIISFITNQKYMVYLWDNINVKVVILSNELFQLNKEKLIEHKIGVLIDDYPEMFFYDIHEYLVSCTVFYQEKSIDKKIGKNCKIADNVIIEDNVVIGDNVEIGYNTIIKKRSIIKNNVKIGCNNVIGAEGFQCIKNSEGHNRMISHVGKCVLGDNVWVGNNCVICKSLLEGEVYVGEYVSIDNLVYIAHNVNIGKNVTITSGVIICGSVNISDNVWIGVNSSINNKVSIGKNALIGMGSVLIKATDENVVEYGNPANFVRYKQ